MKPDKFTQKGIAEVRDNQYLPNGLGKPAASYYYIIDEDGKIYHHDGKFREVTLIDMNKYAFRSKDEAFRKLDELNKKTA